MGIKLKTITKLPPKNPKSSAQEGHETFRVIIFSLHEMVKSFKDLEIPIWISAFSSPAQLSGIISAANFLNISLT